MTLYRNRSEQGSFFASAVPTTFYAMSAKFVSPIFTTGFVISMFVLGLLLLNPSNALAKRTVKGTITDKNGNPAANVRVKAFDDDLWPNPDDFMGQDMTNSNGYYEIHYEGGHWDLAPHWWTIWRPDIFIRVSAPVNGWCDDGEWEPGRNWVHRRDSGATSNHPHRRDLTKNLQLLNFPLNAPCHQTFRRGIDMWSEVDFPLHVSCFACATDGSKIEWGEWGFGGAPKVRTRCWFPPKAKCSDKDYEKIRELGQHPYPVEYVISALNCLVESEDVEDDPIVELKGYLKEAQKHIKGGNNDKAKQILGQFKQKVENERNGGNMTVGAADILLSSADRVISTN